MSVQFNDGLNDICNFLSDWLTLQVCKPTHQQFPINGIAFLQGAMKIYLAFKGNKKHD